jgi:hypothetical protein
MQFMQSPPGTAPNQEPLYTRDTTLYKQRLPNTMNNLLLAGNEYNTAMEELQNKEDLTYQDYLRLQGLLRITT